MVTLAFTSYNKLRNICHIVLIFNGNQIQLLLSKDASNLAYIIFCVFHLRTYLNHIIQFYIFIVPITEYKRPRINLNTSSWFELQPPGRVSVSHNLWRNRLLPSDPTISSPHPLYGCHRHLGRTQMTARIGGQSVVPISRLNTVMQMVTKDSNERT